MVQSIYRGWLLRAKDFYSWIKMKIAQSLKASPSFCMAAFHSLIARSPDPIELQQAEFLIEEMLDASVNAEVTYNALISCYVRLGDFDKVEKWMMKVSEAGFQIDVENFNAALSTCCHRGEMMRASSWLEKSSEMGIIPDEHSYSIVIGGLSKQCIMWLVEEWIKRLWKAGLPFTKNLYVAVITGYADKCDTQKLQHWFFHMLGAGFDVPPQCYCLVVETYVKTNKMKEAMEVLDKLLLSKSAMVSAGHEFPVRPFTLLLNFLAKTKNFSVADEILRKMKEFDISPTVGVFRCLISAAGKEHDWARVDKYTEQGGTQDKSMQVACINTALGCYARAGEKEHAQRWFDQLKTSPGSINLEMYNSMINACAQKGDVAGAVKWLEDLYGNPELKIQGDTYSLVINACSKSGDVDTVMKIFQMMRREGIDPTVRCFNSGLAACAKMGNQKVAEMLMSEMALAGISGEEGTYNTMINCCAKAGDADAAERWLREMQKARSMNEFCLSYTSCVDAYARLNDRHNSKRLFDEMGRNGIKRTIVSYAAVARPWARAGDWNFVESLAKDLQKEGLQINVFFLSELVIAYSKARPPQCDRALKAFRDAVSGPNPIEPDTVLVKALENCVGYEAVEACIQELGVSMKKSPVRFERYGAKPFRQQNNHSGGKLTQSSVNSGPPTEWRQDSQENSGLYDWKSASRLESMRGSGDDHRWDDWRSSSDSRPDSRKTSREDLRWEDWKSRSSSDSREDWRPESRRSSGEDLDRINEDRINWPPDSRRETRQHKSEFDWWSNLNKGNPRDLKSL